MMGKAKFVYDATADAYRCPQGQSLAYATTDRGGYKHYRSDPTICRACPLLASCTTNVAATRTVTRHVLAGGPRARDTERLGVPGRLIYARRKETVERSFADAKQLHGHGYARFRGLMRVAWQALLAAAAQNAKKIAMALTANVPNPRSDRMSPGAAALRTPPPIPRDPPQKQNPAKK